MCTLINIRKEIASRFKYELDRRNLSPAKVSSLVGLPDSVIESYLSGIREISFAEVTTICSGLGINPVRLVYSESYPTSRLAFRNAVSEAQKLAATVEDVFLLIKEFLPKPDLPGMKRTYNTAYERDHIIIEAAGVTEKIRQHLRTPEDFITRYSIPIFPIMSDNADFDAFVMSDGERFTICVNTSKPPQRIRFSLAHEIAHILYDRNTELPIDTLLTNLYWKRKISESEVPEFFAYKFAQFYLIPHDAVFHIAKAWPNLDLGACQRLIDEGRTSKDVLVNAIFDMLTCHREIISPSFQAELDEDDYQPIGDQFRRMDYEEGRDIESRYDEMDSYRTKSPTFKNIQTVLSRLRNNPEAKGVYGFLNEHRNSIVNIVERKKNAFSDKILQHIEEVLKIELR